MSKNNKHIIFDLDGTIIDSRNEIFKTYQVVFNSIPPAKIPDVDGLNYSLTINDLLLTVYGTDADKATKAKQLFVSIYDKSQYSETLLYPDAAELLDALKQAGYELYIATNKRLLPTERILEAKKIRHLFSDIMANDMQPGITLTKRQMISGLMQRHSFSDGYMVGDSVADVEAGKAENLVTIAVIYGYERPELLTALNPAYSADSFQNLYKFVIEHSQH